MSVVTELVSGVYHLLPPTSSVGNSVRIKLPVSECLLPYSLGFQKMFTFLVQLPCTVRLLSFQVVLVDARSHSYVREGSHCEFLLTSFDSSWGVLENPRHSLPPNTTCRYHFQGRRHETVWLSFVKYHAASADTAAYEQGTECNAKLRIWDGRLATSSGSPRQQVS